MGKFRKLLSEIAADLVDHVPDFETGTLDYIFGDKIRIAEKLDGGKKFKIPIQTILSDYDIDFENWVAYKKTDLRKKQPTKLNKVLNRKGSEIKKQSQGDEVNPDLEKIEYLLNVHDLKSQTNAITEPLYVIYSRSPIDVVRMSDFDHIQSCHSPNYNPEGEFVCALADSNNAAAIAYLVTEGKFNTIKNLQSEEIFLDNDRIIGGIEPLARIRLRVVIDGEGEQQVVPSLRVYGKNQFEKIFKEEVTDWAKAHINTKFNWNSKLTRRGGEYEDGGVDVESMLKQIFGKDVRVKFDGTDQYGVDIGESYEERERIAIEEFEIDYYRNLNTLLHDRFTYGGEVVGDIEFNKTHQRLEVEINPPENLDISLPHTKVTKKDNTEIEIFNDGSVHIETPYTFEIHDYLGYNFDGESIDVYEDNTERLIDVIEGIIISYISIHLTEDDDDEIAQNMLEFYSEYYDHLPEWLTDTVVSENLLDVKEYIDRNMDTIWLTLGDHIDAQTKGEIEWDERYKTNGEVDIQSSLEDIIKRMNDDKPFDLDFITNKLYEGFVKQVDEDLEEFEYDEILTKDDIRKSLDIKLKMARYEPSMGDARHATFKVDLGLPTGDFSDESRDYSHFDNFYNVLLGADPELVGNVFRSMKLNAEDYFGELVYKYMSGKNTKKRDEMQMDLSSFKQFYNNFKFLTK